MKELGHQIYGPEKRADFFSGKQLFGTKLLPGENSFFKEIN